MMAVIFDLFDPLENPPEECKEGYDIATKIKDSSLKIYSTQKVAYEKGEAGQAMTFSDLAVEAYGEYVDAVTELGDYLREQGLL